MPELVAAGDSNMIVDGVSAVIGTVADLAAAKLAAGYCGAVVVDVTAVETAEGVATEVDDSKRMMSLQKAADSASDDGSSRDAVMLTDTKIHLRLPPKLGLHSGYERHH